MPKRILIADDYDDIRGMMKFLLEQLGYEVIEAKDGLEAVERAISDRPDLILMDIAMPIMDGIQATQAIREHHELDNVPILAVTAYGDFYNQRARDAGCSDVIQKPIDARQMKPLVSEYVN